VRPAALILVAALSAAADGATRVASFSPGATRTLTDLGATDEVVAVTRWCPLPEGHPAARTCDAFAPDMERLRAARPDVVILPRLANPLWAERCRKEGFRTLVLSPESADSAAADILAIGEAVGRKPAAKGLAAQLGPAYDDASPRRTVAVIWSGVTAGEDSYLAGPLRTFGFTLVPAKGSWNRLDWETLADANPQLIIWVEESPKDGPVVKSAARLSQLSQVPAVKDVRAVREGSVYAVPSGSDWLPGSGLAGLRLRLGDLPR